MKNFTVTSSTESTSTPGLFRIKCSMKDSAWPTFVRPLTVYFNGAEDVPVDTEFAVDPNNVKFEDFDYVLPDSGEVIKLTRAVFV